jgi:hypothetical protein
MLAELPRLVLAPLRLNWAGFDAVRRPDGIGPQVDARGTSAVDPPTFQEVQEVLLARLPEGEPVEGEVILEGHEFRGIPAERIVHELTLDLERARVDPVGRELAEMSGLVTGGVVGGFPRVRFLRGHHAEPVAGRDVAAHGMAAEPVDAAFALLEVDRVGWQVPVHNCVAPPVEVDSFLADTRRGEHKRPERAVEGAANLRLPGAFHLMAFAAVAEGKSAAE